MNHKISLMSFICALMVVIMHSTDAENCDGFGRLVNSLVVDRFFKIAVPFFFVVSGYFVGKHVGENGWWKTAVAKRIKTLLVPFVFWCWLFVIYQVGIAMLAAYISGEPLFANVDLPLIECIFPGVNLFADPSYWPLWYVRALFVIIMVSSPVVMLVKRFGYWVPGVWFILTLWVNGILGIDSRSGYFFNKVVSVYGLFYFALGLCFRLKPITVKISKGNGLQILLAGCAISAVGLFCPIFSSLFITLSCPIIILGIWCVLPSLSLPGWLEGMSFPIYVTHYFSIRLVSLLCKRLGSGGGVKIALSLVVTLVACMLMRRLCPRFSRFVFGGR